MKLMSVKVWLLYRHSLSSSSIPFHYYSGRFKSEHRYMVGQPILMLTYRASTFAFGIAFRSAFG